MVQNSMRGRGKCQKWQEKQIFFPYMYFKNLCMKDKISQFKDSTKSFPVSKSVKAVALKYFALCKGSIFETRYQVGI